MRYFCIISVLPICVGLLHRPVEVSDDGRIESRIHKRSTSKESETTIDHPYHYLRGCRLTLLQTDVNIWSRTITNLLGKPLDFSLGTLHVADLSEVVD